MTGDGLAMTGSYVFGASFQTNGWLPVNVTEPLVFESLTEEILVLSLTTVVAQADALAESDAVVVVFAGAEG